MLISPPVNSHTKEFNKINSSNKDTSIILDKEDKEIPLSDKLNNDNIRCCACRDNDYEWEGGDDDDDKVSIVVDDDPSDSFIAGNLCVESEDNSYMMPLEIHHEHNNFNGGCLTPEAENSKKVNKKKILYMKKDKFKRKKNLKHNNIIKYIKSNLLKPENKKIFLAKGNSNKPNINNFSNSYKNKEKQNSTKTMNKTLIKAKIIKPKHSKLSDNQYHNESYFNKDTIPSRSAQLSQSDAFNNDTIIHNNLNSNETSNNTISNNNTNINSIPQKYLSTFPKPISQTHKQTTMGVNRHICNICGLKFTFRTNLTRHIKNIHSCTPLTSANQLVS